jgi:hypothetical protein
MPIVPGNEPQSAKNRGGSIIGWIVFLLVFGRPLYNVVRSLTTGIVTDQQLMIIAGGALALIALAVIVQRVNRSRQDSTPTLSSSYPVPSNPAASLQQYMQPSDVKLPQTPRFEPIITAKVVLAGLLLALLLFGCGVVALLTMAIP